MSRGFVKKRGDIWYAYYRDGAGKQRAKAIGSRKKEAEAYLSKVQVQVLDGTYKKIEKITFPTFADQWIESYVKVRVKPSTMERYKSILRSSLIPYFGDVALLSITTAQVQQYVADSVSLGKAPATVQKSLVLLKGMFERAIEWNYLKINPAISVKPPRKKSNEMDFLTPEEIVVFLDVVEPEWKPFFYTAILTGMRLGELFALQWSDIDWNSETIRVRKSVWRDKFQEPKSKTSIRAIGMSPTLASVLHDHMKASKPNELDLVFSNEKGSFLDASNVRNRVFEPTLRKARLRRIRLHDLRHTYASMLINQGENLKYIQNQLGHSSITTTVDRYSHLMPDAHKDASARLDQFIFGADKAS